MKSHTSMKKYASNGWPLILAMLLLLTHAGFAIAGPKLTAEGAKKYFGDVNAPTEIDTQFGKKSLLPLQLAAGNNDEMGLNMLRALIEAGALPNKLGPDGDAALHTACSRGGVKNIRLLIKSGADVNLKNKQGETALLKAIDYRKFDAASVLIDLGADVNIADSKGNTAVHAAAQEGNVEQAVSMLKQIMQHGGKINVRNTEGYTPLYALLLNATPKSKPIVQFLLAAGANPNVKDPSGNTVLHNIASEQTDKRDKLVPLLESLIKVGAQVNARNILGETPLYKAVFEDCYLGAEPVISRYLLEHGTDADIKANDGSTAVSISRLPELNCQQPIREMLANSQGKQAKQASTAHPSGPPT